MLEGRIKPLPFLSIFCINSKEGKHMTFITMIELFIYFWLFLFCPSSLARAFLIDVLLHKYF